MKSCSIAYSSYFCSEMKKIISLIIRFIPRKYLQLISHAGARILAIFYLGNKVECPVCGSHYREFLPYGRLNSRANALCPSCLSLERHRLIYLYLKEKTNFFQSPLKVLHIAPELCFLKMFNSMPNIDYITADLESPWAKVKMDVHAIPFEDNTFDVIFCNHLLEHVDDDKRALSEMYRVMKPGGWGIMQSPVNETREVTYEDPSITDPAEREKHFGQRDHLREFGKDYPERLKAGGFTVIVDNYIKTLPFERVTRHSLAMNNRITFGDMIFRVEK